MYSSLNFLIIYFIEEMIIRLSLYNPRTHVGCDCTCVFIIIVSVHFNPRTRVGCDTTNNKFLETCK